MTILFKSFIGSLLIIFGGAGLQTYAKAPVNLNKAIDLTIQKPSNPLPKSQDNNTLELLNPLHNKAKDFRAAIEHYKKSTENQGDTYKNVLKEAEGETKEFEEASKYHDSLMKQYLKGKVKPGEEAIALTKKFIAKEESLNQLLWRLEKMLATITGTIQHSENIVPDQTEAKTMPLEPRSVPVASSRFGKLEEGDLPRAESDMIVEYTHKPLKTPNTDDDRD